MSERVCSSLTGETKMGQTPLKCRSWRSCGSCRWTISKRTVLHGPIKVVPGRDGLVRTGEVKTRASTSSVRPIQELCLSEESAMTERHVRHWFWYWRLLLKYVRYGNPCLVLWCPNNFYMGGVLLGSLFCSCIFPAISSGLELNTPRSYRIHTRSSIGLNLLSGVPGDEIYF